MSRSKYHPHANDNRPQWFDSLLVEHFQYIQMRARFLFGEAADEAAAEATSLALDRWYRFKRDGSFKAWLGFILRDIRYRAKPTNDDAALLADCHPATQETALMAQDAITGDETGVLWLTAIGHTRAEVGAMIGAKKRDVTDLLRAARAVAANDNGRADDAAA